MPGCFRIPGVPIAQPGRHDRARASSPGLRARRRGRAPAVVRQRDAARRRARSGQAARGGLRAMPARGRLAARRLRGLRGDRAAPGRAARPPMPMALPRSTAGIRPRNAGGAELPPVGDRRNPGCACSSLPSSPASRSSARCSRSMSRDEPSYRTLGAYTQPAPTRDAIAVMFDPAITEAEMRRVLTGARCPDRRRSRRRPTRSCWKCRPRRSGEAVQKLRAERMVLFAEPLGARAEPMTMPRGLAAGAAGRRAVRACLRSSRRGDRSDGRRQRRRPAKCW